MIRLDLFLVQNGSFTSRQKAIDAIKAEKVTVNGLMIKKPSYEVDINDDIKVVFDRFTFVSRAGFKLDHALKTFQINLKDKIVIDIGSSTGGFTDCCLQQQAKLVYAIDVGTNQLDPNIRADKRVIVMENTNARYLKKTDFVNTIDFICVDVSFISIKLLIPIIADLLDHNKEAVILIKPQFEVGKRYLNKRGIVKDKKQEKIILNDIASLLLANNLIKSNYIESPLKGRDGNTEYLVYVKKD
jgi:23S rRNA (cytidine1920-2'-O)/16S rRNA (cytidine1409-2'-O)-methyltransferase